MRSLRIALVVAVMLASFASLTAAAGATPATSETIVLKRDANLQTIGWNAYGPTFFDSGSWTGVFGAFAGGSSPIFAGTLKTIETGSAGTFELDFQVLTSPTGGFGGNCQLTGGTGAYADLRGTGTWTFSTDGVTRYYTCTLTVHQDP